jgi:type VI secretion system protein ImpA
MEIVEQYYRKQEPSSPIPLLLQRARVFVDRDFSALLKDVLSKPPS